MSLLKPFKAVIYLGDDRKKTQRSFATQAELDAFMLGVDVTVGWMSYCIDQSLVTNTHLREVYDVLK